jgi:cytochrome c
MPCSPVVAASALALLSSWTAAVQAQGNVHDRVERGRELLTQYQCGSCHTIPGVAGARGRVAQPLTQWRQRSYIVGRLPNRPEVLAQWIAAPQSLVPGTAMPSMGVAATDAQAMAAFLYSLE